MPSDDVKKNDSVDVVEPVDGQCPEGYRLSDDGSRCIRIQAADDKDMVEPETDDTTKESYPYDVKMNNPQFIAAGVIDVVLEDGRVVRFESGEEIELVVDESDDSLYIGSEGEIIEIPSAELARQFLEALVPCADVEDVDDEMTIGEAFRNGYSLRDVVDILVEAGAQPVGSFKRVIRGGKLKRIKVRRRIKRRRSVKQKAALVKARRLARTSSAMRARMRSMRLRKKFHLD